MLEIDKRLRVIEEGRKTGFRTLIETGTCHGAMVEACIPYFDKIFSIELSVKFYEECCVRFKGNRNVCLLQGDSSIVLPYLLDKTLDRPTIFWLDAHCSGGDTAGDPNNSPLEAEIAAILKYRSSGIILIDDQHLTPEELAANQEKYPGYQYDEPISRIDISLQPGLVINEHDRI